MTNGSSPERVPSGFRCTSYDAATAQIEVRLRLPASPADDSRSQMQYSPERRESVGMKILLVDDHVLIREALRGVLKELKPVAIEPRAGEGRWDAMAVYPGLRARVRA